MTSLRSDSGRVLGLVALATAVFQSARALFRGSTDYAVTIVIAWGAAWFLARQVSPELKDVPSAASKALGTVALLVAFGTAALLPSYNRVERLMPLLAGLGLVLLAAGLRAAAARYWRALLFLALPVVNPLPLAVTRRLEPLLVAWTTPSAAFVGRALGLDVVRDGNSLVMPMTSLDVINACSGVLGISRLLVLAALVVGLFDTNRWQKVAVFGSAVAVGFFANAVRVAVLAVVVVRDEPHFDVWDAGLGAVVFAVVTPAIAGLVWWRILLRSGRPVGASTDKEGSKACDR